MLRRQVATLAAELVERDRMLHTIHSMKGRGAQARDGGGGEDDLALQVGPRGCGWARGSMAACLCAGWTACVDGMHACLLGSPHSAPGISRIRHVTSC